MARSAIALRDDRHDQRKKEMDTLAFVPLECAPVNAYPLDSQYHRGSNHDAVFRCRKVTNFIIMANQSSKASRNAPYARIKRVIKRIILRTFNPVLNRVGFDLVNAIHDYPVLRPMDANGVEILADPEFQRSCKAIGSVTMLDTPRLANLWMLARLTDANGAIAEIGTYRGGGAVHLSNCCPDRQIVVCDPFSRESFEALDSKLDMSFRQGQFSDHREEQVRSLFKGRKALIIPGYFPQSVAAVALPKLSFVHLDVDVYKASKESLSFLLGAGALCERSLIVLDDYNRTASGVNKAVEEIVSEQPGTLAFPMFPGQAIIVPRTWRPA